MPRAARRVQKKTATGTAKDLLDGVKAKLGGTPNLLTTKTGEMELVVPVPEKVYGVDPQTGQQKWFVTTTLKNEMNGSVIVKDDVAYLYGGFRGVGSLAGTLAEATGEDVGRR